MKPRFLLITLLVVVALLGVSGRRLLHAQLPTAPTTTNIPQSQSYLVILGIGDQAATTWDGSITVTGANLQVVRGWRFTPDDSITTASWKLSTRTSPALNGPGPIQENGVIVKISTPASSATLNVTTAQGNFSFSTQDLPFGVSKTFLSGKALVAQTNAQFQLTTSSEEEDFPVMAQSGDDVYLIYTEFVHGDRSVATGQGTKQPITDFSFLARPAGGDQVLLHALFEITADLDRTIPGYRHGRRSSCAQPLRSMDRVARGSSIRSALGQLRHLRAHCQGRWQRLL